MLVLFLSTSSTIHVDVTRLTTGLVNAVRRTCKVCKAIVSSSCCLRDYGSHDVDIMCHA